MVRFFSFSIPSKGSISLINRNGPERLKIPKKSDENERKNVLIWTLIPCPYPHTEKHNTYLSTHSKPDCPSLTHKHTPQRTTNMLSRALHTLVVRLVVFSFSAEEAAQRKPSKLPLSHSWEKVSPCHNQLTRITGPRERIRFKHSPNAFEQMMYSSLYECIWCFKPC